MTDQPTTPLTDILRNDQLTAEMNATIRPIAAAYLMLRNAGMPEDAAASIAGQYGDLRLARHFDIPTIQYRPTYTGEDD